MAKAKEAPSTVAVDFLPDWSATWTAEQAESELSDFEFKGPGVYHSKGDTTIVIPLDRPPGCEWHQRYIPEERFRFHVYNGRDPGLALNRLIHAPSRVDDR